MTPTSSRQVTGAQGESLGVRYLQEKGYEILEQNFRCKLGELDIVAKMNEYLVFCEVKTKRDPKFHPSYSITQKKMKKLHQLGLFYMSSRRLHQLQPRFDVLAIQLFPNRAPLIEHFINAF